MEIAFVRTGHYYEPYIDFFKLAELAGFPIIQLSEVDVSQHKVFIVSPHNGEWNPHISNQDDKPRNAHLILWNIERPSGSKGSVGNYGESNRKLIYDRYFDEVWVSDRRLADETTLRYVTLGSHEGMGSISNDKRYVFCHMSYEVPRRQTILKHFNPDDIGQNCWPPERDDVLRQSYFALNIHQDNHPFQEPLRFALFAAYGLPIISESIYDAYPYGNETMAFANYDDLVRRTRELLKSDYGQWREMGERCREMMCNEFEFGKMVRQAVDESVNRWR
jgi:hypothetical protein